jgi:hypothetical protein
MNNRRGNSSGRHGIINDKEWRWNGVSNGESVNRRRHDVRRIKL